MCLIGIRINRVEKGKELINKKQLPVMRRVAPKPVLSSFLNYYSFLIYFLKRLLFIVLFFMQK